MTGVQHVNHPPAPPLDPNEANYARCQVTEVLPVPFGTFFDWYFVEPVEHFMRGTVTVAAITSVENIPGFTYGRPREPRIYHFRDGTRAYEHVLESNFPHGYSYQSWAFTNPVKFICDHAKARMRAEPDGTGRTKITWDYAFHARNRLVLPFLQLFVGVEWRRSMRSVLGILKAHLARHGTTSQIHDV